MGCPRGWPVHWFPDQVLSQAGGGQLAPRREHGTVILWVPQARRNPGPQACCSLDGSQHPPLDFIASESQQLGETFHFGFVCVSELGCYSVAKATLEPTIQSKLTLDLW